MVEYSFPMRMQKRHNNILLEARDLSVTLGGEKILKNISFILKRGSALAVIGPNGAGKSVFLRTLIGLVPFEGTLHIDASVRIGYIPQRIFIDQYLRLTVDDFFSIKQRLLKLSSSAVKDAMKCIQLPSDILKKQLIHLSVGTLQRVMLVFAILAEPELLLFDEPTANIDIPGEQTIYDSLHRLQDKKDMSIILVSHDLYTVNKYADLILCLNREMVCFGDTHDFLEPHVLKKLFGDTVLYHHKHDDLFEH